MCVCTRVCVFRGLCEQSWSGCTALLCNHWHVQTLLCGFAVNALWVRHCRGFKHTQIHKDTHKIHRNKITDAYTTLHHHVWEYTVMQTCTSEDTQTLDKPLVSLSALTLLENTQMHAQAHTWSAAAIKCYSQNRQVKEQFSRFLLSSLATCKQTMSLFFLETQ